MTHIYDYTILDAALRENPKISYAQYLAKDKNPASLWCFQMRKRKHREGLNLPNKKPPITFPANKLKKYEGMPFDLLKKNISKNSSGNVKTQIMHIVEELAKNPELPPLEYEHANRSLLFDIKRYYTIRDRVRYWLKANNMYKEYPNSQGTPVEDNVIKAPQNSKTEGTGRDYTLPYILEVLNKEKESLMLTPEEFEALPEKDLEDFVNLYKQSLFYLKSAVAVLEVNGIVKKFRSQINNI